MLFTSAKMTAQFALDYDSHGDSYTEDVNEEKLREVFANVEKKVSLWGSFMGDFKFRHIWDTI